MSRKKSVIAIFFFAVSMLTLVQYHFDVKSAQLRGYEIVQKRRERDILLLSAMTGTLLKLGDREVVERHLVDAIRVGWIDFYMLSFEREPVGFSSVRPLSDAAYATIRDRHPPEHFWEFRSEQEAQSSIRIPASGSGGQHAEDFRFLETDFGKGWSGKFGISLDRQAFLDEANELTKHENRRILLLGLVLTLCAFLYAARDLLAIASVIRRKGFRGLSGLNAVSREAEILKSGLAGVHEGFEQLRARERKLESQVLPSLQSELSSGRKPPYDFDCTMVRVDINGFTKIFHQFSRDEFLATINQFFTACSHVVSKYDGLIHEFVGDEIIFYMKDEKHKNSFTAALACCQEILAVAEGIHTQTSQHPGYPFRVKASLAHGRLRFGPLLDGFSLAGAPLIETTRILSTVHEKDESTVHFDSAHQFRLHDLIAVDTAARVQLKGLEGERQLLRYRGHQDLGAWMRKWNLVSESDRAELIGALYDYRRESDLTAVLTAIEERPDNQLEIEPLVEFLSRLRVTNSSERFQMIFIRQVASLVECRDDESRRILASLISAWPNLIGRKGLAGAQALFLRLLDHDDNRIVANSIAALDHAGVELAPLRGKARAKIDSSDRRVMANALIFVGGQEISPLVVQKLRQLLRSSDEALLASTVYALGEIAKRHRESDPVHFRTQTEFLVLLENLEGLARKRPALKHLINRALQNAGRSTSKQQEVAS